ncbi:MAG: RtcB family protein [Candidatus Marsarchaeota archaeon]
MAISMLKKISDNLWEVPVGSVEGMRVPARFYSSETLMRDLDERAVEQAINVATLPGIKKYSIAMPDAHWGYGFPIGGIAAFDPQDNGIITVGGIGFDVNCGVRLIATNLNEEDIRPKLRSLMDALFEGVPAGLGSEGLHLNQSQLQEVMLEGARWVVRNGYGWERDLRHIEDGGMIEGADPSNVSKRAKEREANQLGSLGSGNHYLEVQVVEEVYDPAAAKAFGLEKGQVVIMIHTGSRAMGHQIGMDYIEEMAPAMKRYGIQVRDKELVSVPFNSPEGKRYFSAMNVAMNIAWANREMITYYARQAFSKAFGSDPESLGMELVYDVGHNTGKLEYHDVEGQKKLLLVHRKGSTRALGPGREELPPEYRDVGQPVLIGGSMGTSSYVLKGTLKGLQETFGSAVHGAGRKMSRTQAKKEYRGEQLVKELERRGIIVRGHSWSGLAEEAPDAYKDVSDVVSAVHQAGISTMVVKLRPLGTVKG